MSTKKDNDGILPTFTKKSDMDATIPPTVVQPNIQLVKQVPYDTFFKYIKYVKGTDQEYSEIDDMDLTTEKVQAILKDKSVEYLQDLSLKTAAKFVLSQFIALKHREALANEQMVILGACEQWAGESGRPYEKVHVTLARIDSKIIDHTDIGKLQFDTGEYWRDTIIKALDEPFSTVYPNFHEAITIGEIKIENTEKYGEQRYFKLDSFEELTPIKDVHEFLDTHTLDIEDIYEEELFYDKKGTVLVKGKIFEFRPLSIVTKKFEEKTPEGKTKPPTTKTVNVLPFLNGGKFAAQVNVDLGKFSGKSYFLKVNIYPGQYSQAVINLGKEQTKLFAKLLAMQEDTGVPEDAVYDNEWTKLKIRGEQGKEIDNKKHYRNFHNVLTGQARLLTNLFKGSEFFFAGRLTRKLISEEDRQKSKDFADSKKTFDELKAEDDKRWLEMDATLMYVAKSTTEEVVNLGDETVTLEVTVPVQDLPKKAKEVLKESKQDLPKEDQKEDTFMLEVDKLRPIVYNIIKYKQKTTEDQIKDGLGIQGFANVAGNVLDEALTQLLQEGKIIEAQYGIYHLVGLEEKPAIPPVSASPKVESLSTVLFAFLTDVAKTGMKGLTRKGLSKKFMGLGATQPGFETFIAFLEKYELMISPKDDQYKFILDSDKATKLIPLIVPLLTGILQEKITKDEEIKKQWETIVTPVPIPATALQVATPAPVSSNTRIDAAITEAMKMFTVVESLYDSDEDSKKTTLKALTSNFKNNVNLKPVIKQSGPYTEAEILQVYNKIMAERKK